MKNIKEDYFVNQTLIIDRALHLEKDLNDKLLELHKCKSNYEMSCRVKNKNVFKTFKPIPEGNNDPHVIITIIIIVIFFFSIYILPVIIILDSLFFGRKFYSKKSGQD